MKIKVELELDTDKESDLIKAEKVLNQLQQIQEILEKLDYNLNKGNKRSRE